MIKLLKKENGNLLYWEIWFHKEILIVHFGEVGRTGESHESICAKKDAESRMNELAEEQIRKGFYRIEDEKLEEICVFFQPVKKRLAKSSSIQSQFELWANECLGWTGNGYCDGGEVDVNSGAIYAYCFVLNVDFALESIRKKFEKQGFLDEFAIAIFKDDDYLILHPENKKGETIPF